MARRFKNPLGFSRGPVTVIICAVYIAVFTGLLYTHHVVPRAPKKASPAKGVNTTESWRDLQFLSSTFHPYNSRSNDVVREWLLKRVEEVSAENRSGIAADDPDALTKESNETRRSPIEIFNDLHSNTSFPFGNVSTYFEGTNIITYIRGTEDDKDDWWRQLDARRGDRGSKPHGVLVNAHYDSVATGFGATDDGVGVVTILQLIRYYSRPGNAPKRGIVFLLNNGEEDYLNGAYAFLQHPISHFVDTFLNLEGAGAGGRATLFRSTDAEVTKAYQKAKYPFGTVLSSDAFKRGLIRSQTDYSVFNGQRGLRGLDVAFFEPRSRYHTGEDSSRYSSRDSIWHMLSAALAATKELTSDTKTDFEPHKGSIGVWFDVFGRAFGLLTLQALFGLTIALLVVAPVVVITVILILRRVDKYYLFARKARSDPLDPHTQDESAVIEFGGWKGMFRFPIAFIIASVAVLALALLVAKVNPLIVYSSQYAVWTMLLSAWLVIAWFFLRGADFMRPSALQRAHTLGWHFFIFWLLLVATAAIENMRQIAGVYPVAIFFSTVFVCVLVSYLEFFALPKKAAYIEQASRRTEEDEETTPTPTATATSRQRGYSGGSSRVLGQNRGDSRPRSSRDHARASRDEDREATETTSLLGRKRPRSHGQTSRQSSRGPITRLTQKLLPYGDEQPWSAHLPSILWLLQFLILTIPNLIILGPVALFLSSALHQTPADGSSPLFIYIAFAILSILLLLPTTPFLHRIHSRVPLFLFLAFIGTLVYNLTAFPFSSENRLKVFFRQDLDIDTGLNTVSLTGLDGYVQTIIADLPSSGGQQIACHAPELKAKEGLVTCRWPGLAPNVVPPKAGEGNITVPPSLVPPEKRYHNWVHLNVTRGNGSETQGEAVFELWGRETRACRLVYERPIVDFEVEGSALPEQGKKRVGENGAREVRLWRREWEVPWRVRIWWNITDGDVAVAKKGKDGRSKEPARGLDGKAVCLWSDANMEGTIPAFDEVKQYMPIWSIVTKLDDGLVTGSKRFLV